MKSGHSFFSFNHTNLLGVLILILATWIHASRGIAQISPSDLQNPVPLDVPPLIPEPLLEANPIVADPTPVLQQPDLFPPDTSSPMVRKAERVARDVATAEPAPAAGFEDAFSGAASNFGFNQGAGSLMRPSVIGAQAERERDRITARAERQSTLEHYNIKLGPIPFRFGAGIEFQFTDNANLSKTDKVADLSIVPHIDLYGGIRLTSQNTLSIQLGLGYIWNLNRPELDRALTNASVGLDSDSGLSFDIKMGNFRINIFERPAIPRQQFDLITQRNPLQYSQFTNSAGISVFWDVNSRLAATMQYSHTNILALKSEAENLNQSSDMLGGSASYRFTDALSVGLQANASHVKYDRGFLNDSTNYSAGFTVTARTGRNMTVSLAGGYQGGQFGSGGAIGDGSGLGDWYLRVALAHNINRSLSQTISIGHESQLGTASNSTKIDYIRHQLNLNISRNFGIGGTLSYESAVESGGVFAQEFKLFQFGVFGYWSMSKKLGLTFSYRLVARESSGAQDAVEGVLDYVENRIDLGLQVNL